MTHGGKRNNAGRKPVKDKVVQVNIYPKASHIKKVGGIKKAKELALAAIIGESWKYLEKIFGELNKGCIFDLSKTDWSPVKKDRPPIMPTFTAVFHRANCDQMYPQMYTKIFTAPSLEDATIQAEEWAEERDEYFAQIDQD